MEEEDDVRRLNHDLKEVKRECLKLINYDSKCSSGELGCGQRWCKVLLYHPPLLFLLVLLAMFVYNFYQKN